jgi:hypothetical protein
MGWWSDSRCRLLVQTQLLKKKKKRKKERRKERKKKDIR